MINFGDESPLRPPGRDRFEASQEDEQSERKSMIEDQRHLSREADRICADLAIAYVGLKDSQVGSSMHQAIREAVDCLQELSEYLDALASDFEKGRL
ncbi:MAG: hypothetical protein ACJ796_01905 [Gemmatimonadaceae bacterium]